MGCQHKIGALIVNKKADYVLALKGNQGEFHDDIKLFLDKQLETEYARVAHDMYTSVDGGHGRIETRKVWVVSDVKWLIDRHPQWKSVGSISVVESTREINGHRSDERRYYVSSHKNVSAEFMAQAIRSHWHIENKLHWQLDVSFNEDNTRLRSGYGAENISMLNKLALNLLKNEKSIKLGVKNKRLKAGWDTDYMLKVLTVGLNIG